MRGSDITSVVRDVIEENDETIRLLHDQGCKIKLEIQSQMSALYSALRTREMWLINHVDTIVGSHQSAVRNQKDMLHEICGQLSHREPSHFDLHEASAKLKNCFVPCRDISLKVAGNINELKQKILNFGGIVEEEGDASTVNSFEKLRNCIMQRGMQELQQIADNHFGRDTGSFRTRSVFQLEDCDRSLGSSSGWESSVGSSVSCAKQTDERRLDLSADKSPLERDAVKTTESCIDRIRNSPSHLWIAPLDLRTGSDDARPPDGSAQVPSWKPYKFVMETSRAETSKEAGKADLSFEPFCFRASESFDGCCASSSNNSLGWKATESSRRDEEHGDDLDELREYLSYLTE